MESRRKNASRKSIMRKLEDLKKNKKLSSVNWLLWITVRFLSLTTSNYRSHTTLYTPCPRGSAVSGVVIFLCIVQSACSWYYGQCCYTSVKAEEGWRISQRVNHTKLFPWLQTPGALCPAPTKSIEWNKDGPVPLSSPLCVCCLCVCCSVTIS